jgi:hypothetical protein
MDVPTEVGFVEVQLGGFELSLGNRPVSIGGKEQTSNGSENLRRREWLREVARQQQVSAYKTNCMTRS